MFSGSKLFCSLLSLASFLHHTCFCIALAPDLPVPAHLQWPKQSMSGWTPCSQCVGSQDSNTCATASWAVRCPACCYRPVAQAACTGVIQVCMTAFLTGHMCSLQPARFPCWTTQHSLGRPHASFLTAFLWKLPLCVPPAAAQQLLHLLTCLRQHCGHLCVPPLQPAPGPRPWPAQRKTAQPWLTLERL